MNIFFQNMLNFLRPRQQVPLRPDALRVVQQLADCSWFSSVGELLPRPAYQVATWYEAIQHATSLDHDDFVLERANEFRLSMYEREPARLDSWNSVIVEIKRHSEPLDGIVNLLVDRSRCACSMDEEDGDWAFPTMPTRQCAVRLPRSRPRIAAGVRRGTPLPSNDGDEDRSVLEWGQRRRGNVGHDQAT